MTGHEVDIRLLGFAGFEASRRFLHAIDDEIWVERWQRDQLEVVRPTDLHHADDLRGALELPCHVAVVSAHGGCEGQRMLFSDQERDGEILYLDTIGRLGATSAVLIDACSAKKFFAQLQCHAAPGVVLVGTETDDECTRGRDSVTVIADVIRELCYTHAALLDPGAVDRAVDRVNAQITARNELVPGGSGTARPSVLTCKCPGPC